MNKSLLGAIALRAKKNTEFGYGITTADKYVSTLAEHLDGESRKLFVGNGFDEIMRKASENLVYSNREMASAAEAIESTSELLKGIDLPKNTLMVFRNVLTSTRKDRDGDVLHSDGAIVDPKMLLLWQHVPTMPIGKYLATVEQNEKRLVVISCIVDMNALSHDAAVMVDNKMGRFSHGFRAIKYDEIKESGFDVKEYEIMEESLVSVPSNTDAETEEVILSLVEGGKLTSPLMKQIGNDIRERRSVIVPAIKYREDKEGTRREIECNSFAELKAASELGLIGDKKDEDLQRTGNDAERIEGKDDAGTPKKTHVDPEEGKAKESGDEEVKLWVGDIEASWEGITTKLNEQVRKYLQDNSINVGEDDYVWIVATFDDYVIARCYFEAISGEVYYKIFWEMVDDMPKFTGVPEKVDVQVNVDIVSERLTSLQTKAEAVSLNQSGVSQAKKLANAGDVQKPDSWSPPSADSANSYIEENGIAAYAKWHLGVRKSVDAESKGAYAYIYTSDFKSVDRAGVIAIRQRAGQQDETEIFNAAGAILEIIDADEDKSTEVNPMLESEKSGRVLSKANESKIRDAKEDIDEAAKMDDVPRPCRALLKNASGNLGSVIDSLGISDEEGKQTSAREAFSTFLRFATPSQRVLMSEFLKHDMEIQRQDTLVRTYRHVLDREGN